MWPPAWLTTASPSLLTDKMRDVIILLCPLFSHSSDWSFLVPQRGIPQSVPNMPPNINQKKLTGKAGAKSTIPSTLLGKISEGCDSLVAIFFVFLLLPPRWVKSELQLPTYTTATTMPNPHHICDLYHSSWQHRILHPLSEGSRQVLNPLSHNGNSLVAIFEKDNSVSSRVLENFRMILNLSVQAREILAKEEKSSHVPIKSILDMGHPHTSTKRSFKFSKSQGKLLLMNIYSSHHQLQMKS